MSSMRYKKVEIVVVASKAYARHVVRMGRVSADEQRRVGRQSNQLRCMRRRWSVCQYHLQGFLETQQPGCHETAKRRDIRHVFRPWPLKLAEFRNNCGMRNELSSTTT